MCGIVGILNSRSSAEQADMQNVAHSMMQQLHHRGPDDQGCIELNGAVLGHKRLSIIDLEHGHQPMISGDGRYALVFNGEIYNYIELRNELIGKGVSFQTFSDSEVLLQMLIQYGEQALSKLIGMFAFCFVDTHSGKWLMARDHFGIKPLYYRIFGDAIYFASEIKALTETPEFKAQVSRESLNQYFTFQFCIGENTLFNDITKLDAATYIKGKGNKVTSTDVYWSPDYEPDESHTEEYFLEKLSSLLQDSARLQIRSDVPLGAYLSGGLDSSIVSSLASNVLHDSVPLFTGKFAEGPEYDETPYARQVCQKINGRLHEITPSANDFVEYLPYVIKMMDEPLAGPGVFPQFMVSREASKHVKVVLGGQGGDEIFGGYARYLVGYLEQSLKAKIMQDDEEGSSAIPLEHLMSNLQMLKQYKPMLSNFWKQGLFDDMDRRYFRLIDRSPDLGDILTGEMLDGFCAESVFEDFQSIFNRIESPSYINKMTHFDLKTLLPALLHVEDRVSMAASIESRVPLLDWRIVDLVSSIPASIKFNGGETKSLLKKAAGHLIPKSINERKDKMGFPVPLNDWMKSGIVRDFVIDTLSSTKSLNRGIYKPEVLRNAGQFGGVGGRQLWGILSLELWHQEVLGV